MGLRRAAATEELTRRTVVQGTLQRATIHLVSAGDYWPFAVAVRQARRDSYLRAHRSGPGAGRLAETAGRLRTALSSGPLHRTELDLLLGPADRSGVGLWLDLLRVPPAGTWEHRRADVYAAAEDWLGACELAPEHGVQLLVCRTWPGSAPRPCRDRRLGGAAGPPRRRRPGSADRAAFRAEDGAALVDLPGAPLPDPATPAPVRFLPVFDAALLVHARRSGVLPEAHRSTVFSSKTPQSAATFLVDGVVAGTWRYQGGRIQARNPTGWRRRGVLSGRGSRAPDCLPPRGSGPR